MGDSKIVRPRVMSLSVGREANREFYRQALHDFHKKKYLYKIFIVPEAIMMQTTLSMPFRIYFFPISQTEDAIVQDERNEKF